MRKAYAISMDINLLPANPFATNPKPLRGAEAYTPQQIDYILDAIYGRTLSEDERAVLLNEIMPPADEQQARGNAELVTTDFAQKYANCRAMGLTQADAARYCGVTPSILASMLLGFGLTAKQHELMLLAEHDAKARFIYKNLSVLNAAAQSGKWKAAVALLEKVHPEEYGRRMAVHNSGSLIMGTGDCEKKAVAAAQELEALRAQRALDEQQLADSEEA